MREYTEDTAPFSGRTFARVQPYWPTLGAHFRPVHLHPVEQQHYSSYAYVRYSRVANFHFPHNKISLLCTLYLIFFKHYFDMRITTAPLRPYPDPRKCTHFHTNTYMHILGTANMHHGRALRALRAYSILGKLFADFPASFVFVLGISACVRVRMRMCASSVATPIVGFSVRRRRRCCQAALAPCVSTKWQKQQQP